MNYFLMEKMDLFEPQITIFYVESASVYLVNNGKDGFGGQIKNDNLQSFMVEPQITIFYVKKGFCLLGKNGKDQSGKQIRNNLHAFKFEPHITMFYVKSASLYLVNKTHD